MWPKMDHPGRREGLLVSAGRPLLHFLCTAPPRELHYPLKHDCEDDRYAICKSAGTYACSRQRGRAGRCILPHQRGLCRKPHLHWPQHHPVPGQGHRGPARRLCLAHRRRFQQPLRCLEQHRESARVPPCQPPGRRGPPLRPRPLRVPGRSVCHRPGLRRRHQPNPRVDNQDHQALAHRVFGALHGRPYSVHARQILDGRIQPRAGQPYRFRNTHCHGAGLQKRRHYLGLGLGGGAYFADDRL